MLSSRCACGGNVVRSRIAGMFRAHSLLLLPAFFMPLPISAQQPAPSPSAAGQQQQLAAARRQLIDANGPGTDAALRTQLLTMLQQDQQARGLGTTQPSAGGPAFATNLAAIDAVLTKQLKDIVAQRGFPTIALVGLDASNAAILLLNHTADLAWRRSLLPQLETLADTRKLDPAQVAIVIDKQLVADGRPQRYGTQFKMVDGQMAMISVEDPGGLDTLRTRALLPPMDAYKQTLARMYHLKVSNKIVSPPTAFTPSAPTP